MNLLNVFYLKSGNNFDLEEEEEEKSFECKLSFVRDLFIFCRRLTEYLPSLNDVPFKYEEILLQPTSLLVI